MRMEDDDGNLEVRVKLSLIVKSQNLWQHGYGGGGSDNEDDDDIWKWRMVKVESLRRSRGLIGHGL